VGSGDVRRTLDGIGGSGAPLDFTEVGWSTVRTPEAAPRSLARRARSGSPQLRCKIEVLLPHTWLTAETDRTSLEGLVWNREQNGPLKPSGRAYLAAVSSVEKPGRRRSTRICTAAPGIAP